MYEKIVKISRQFLKIKYSNYRRYLIQETEFSHRMSVIVGARGIGKTTTLVQLLLDRSNGDRFSNQILYVQADHFVLGDTSLYEIAEQFHTYGGKWMAIDEIHKYPNWSKELKSIYDTFPDLSLFVSGSSALEIYRGSHDLIRRAVSYDMQGLSFREYLEMAHNLQFSSITLEEICENHERIVEKILDQCEEINRKILPEFYNYLTFGYYPYFFELANEEIYRMTLDQNLHMTIESDLSAIYPHLTGNSIKKIKQLLIFVANAVPFTPNWNKLMSILEIGDPRTLKTYFNHLEDANLIRAVGKANKKFSQLESDDKLYLNNTNQLFAVSSKTPEKGTIRETFFLSSVSVRHKVQLPQNGDFLVNERYLFEVGGKNKSFNQIKGISASFLACDNLEQGIGNKIPLWLFGFLY